MHEFEIIILRMVTEDARLRVKGPLTSNLGFVRAVSSSEIVFHK